MQIFGILNLTPDSFSDFIPEKDQVLNKVKALIESGADIIDIGAESTNPKSKPISADEEISRLEDYVLDIINLCKLNGKKVSIDTYKSKTAKFAVDLGVDYINDVSALHDPKMLDIICNSNVKYIFMHNLGIPTDKSVTISEDNDVIETLMECYHDKIQILEQFIPKDRLIFDPGIGFGKTKLQDLEIIERAGELKKLIDIPLLYGHSRKSFLTLFTSKQPSERDIETHEISLKLMDLGIDYLRLHKPFMRK